MTPRFSGRKLIGQFGTMPELVAAAEKHGVKITYFQVRKWHARDTVSIEGLAALLMLAELTGKTLDLPATLETEVVW